VETYRGRIRDKLNIGRGSELAHYAMQWVMQTGQEQPEATSLES
jgi:hypothetical protein